MEKFSQKTEETVLIITAFFVLISSMLNAMVSAVIAVASLLIFFAYNFTTNKKA